MGLLSFTECKNKNMNHISMNIELNYVGNNHKYNKLQPSVSCEVVSVRLPKYTEAVAGIFTLHQIKQLGLQNGDALYWLAVSCVTSQRLKFLLAPDNVKVINSVTKQTEHCIVICNLISQSYNTLFLALVFSSQTKRKFRVKAWMEVSKESFNVLFLK